LSGAIARTRLDSFDAIERLVSVEMRLPTLPQGLVPRIALAARDGGTPPVYQVARVLESHPRSRIAIFTGIVVDPYLELGETDGIVGAVVLSRGLRSLGYRPEVFVEARQVQPLRRLFEVSGIRDVSVGETTAFRGPDSVDIAIAIEKIAKNARGVRHSLLGTPLTQMADEVDDYFKTISAAGLPTVGIGDGGNEVGFGRIAPQLAEILGASADCACGCAGGVVSATATGAVIVAATANLGVYALLAALALVLERPEVCADAAFVLEVMKAAVGLGFIDAGTLDPAYVGEDGVPGDAIAAFVLLLGTIVRQELKPATRRPF
jgi:hypothetical protein